MRRCLYDLTASRNKLETIGEERIFLSEAERFDDVALIEKFEEEAVSEEESSARLRFCCCRGVDEEVADIVEDMYVLGSARVWVLVRDSTLVISKQQERVVEIASKLVSNLYDSSSVQSRQIKKKQHSNGILR